MNYTKTVLFMENKPLNKVFDSDMNISYHVLNYFKPVR